MFWLLLLIVLIAVFGVGAVIEGILELALIAILLVVVVGLVAAWKIRSRSTTPQ